MAALAAGGHRFHLQLAAERAPVFGLHDGRLRHSLRLAGEEPDPVAVIQLVAGPLPGGRDSGAGRRRGAEPL